MGCVLQFGKSVRLFASLLAPGRGAFAGSAIYVDVFRLFLFDFDIFHKLQFSTRGFQDEDPNLLHCNVCSAEFVPASEPIEAFSAGIRSQTKTD
jgi:hypothetical protein